MSNLATHQPPVSNSIAAACLARLGMKRELEVAPGYSIRKTKRTYQSFEYRDIIGNPCKRKDLSALYGTSESVVSDAYKKSEGNFLLANIKLMKRLRVNK
jgi:hypothetical protein